MASIKDIMKFFGYVSSSEFSSDWKALSEDEKNWFKEEVFKTMN